MFCHGELFVLATSRRKLSSLTIMDQVMLPLYREELHVFNILPVFSSFLSRYMKGSEENGAELNALVTIFSKPSSWV
jgi:hypothetical protein